MHDPVRRTFSAVVMAAAISAALVSCSDPSTESAQGTNTPTEGQEGTHGPFFPECGGISDEVVEQLTQTSRLVNTAKNSTGCQWLVDGSVNGPHFSFTWFRGSPIARERKVEELSRTKVEDITIEGHSGFIASNIDPQLGNILCEIGIQFGDDFIEWSVSYYSEPFPDSCVVATELTRQSIVNSK